jgi:hypothetical protein
MKFAPLIALLILASCGADGEPTKPGVSVSGEARIGVVSQ